MNLNWKLIIQLSGFGLAMGVSTVWWISSMIEPFLWIAIFTYSAYMVAKQAAGGFFLHGFLISLVNCVWVTSAHVIFFGSYATNHQAELEMTPFLPEHPRLVMLIIGPIIGVVSGLVLGLFCLVASKIVKK